MRPPHSHPRPSIGPTSLVFLALAPLAALSCSLPDSQTHAACVTDDDCNPGHHCAAQLCVLLPDAAAQATDADVEHGEPHPILQLSPAEGASTAFGDVSIGQTRDEAFLVKNLASIASKALQIALTQETGAPFAVLDPTPGECVFGITSLGGGEQCSFRIRFAPEDSGERVADLSVRSDGTLDASLASVVLTGKGVLPASLSGIASHDFGTVLVGSKSDPVPWEIDNLGDLESEVPVLVNSAPTELIVDATECDRVLGPHDSCTLHIAFAPAAAGSRRGTLTFSAGDAGAVTFSASAIGELPASLALDPVDDGGNDFGDPFLGQTVDRTFLLHNLGQQSSSAIDFALDAMTSDFAFLSGDPNDCTQSMILDGDESCRIRVRFSPSVEGSQSTVLRVSAAVGRNVTLELRGNAHGGAIPPSLSASTSAAAFDPSDPGVTTMQTVTWTVTNPGDLSTGVPTLGNSDPAEILIQSNDCVAALGTGDTCAIEVAFRPSVCGPRAGTLTLDASPGGSASLAVSGAGRCRLTVVKSGTGIGTVSGRSFLNNFGVFCDASCTETSVLVDPGTELMLSATTTNGSDSFFAGWSTGTCQGRATCILVVDNDTILTTPFASLDANLVFMTPDVWATNRLGVVGYDQTCNKAATNAGINNAEGTGYIAFVSDTNSSAMSRLGSARGWVRRDGKPFADTQTALFGMHAVLNSVRFDAWGVDLGGASTYLTGTRTDGNLFPGEACTDWTSTTPGDLVIGTAEGGPFGWTGNVIAPINPVGCGRTYRLLCMGNTHASAVSPPETPGRKIWMTNTPFLVGGPSTPDDKCLAEKPDGVTAAAALVGYTDRPASAVLVPDVNYLRPDGTLVGSGAQIVSGQRLESGPWQTADGRYVASYVWIGQQDLQTTGTVASTCADWTDVTQTAGGAGKSLETFPPWSSSIYLPISCQASVANLLCVEVAP